MGRTLRSAGRTAAFGAVIGLLVLGGCGRSQDGAAGSPPPPADAAPPPAAAAPSPAPAAAPSPAADFTKPLNAVGTEPFWSVRVYADGFTYSAPDLGDVTAANPGPKIEGDGAVWRVTGSDGKPMVLSLKPGTCSDGMSDFKHPFTATLERDGKTLKGCATWAEDKDYD